MSAFDVVIPTAGRPALVETLASLARSRGPRPGRVVVVDDRRGQPQPLEPQVDGWLAERLVVTRSGGAGPAAARNVGWRQTDAEWVAFLDDDVRLPPDWLARLADDLDRLPAAVWGCQGRVIVPRPLGRRATDWERATAGLESARWATADMAYRRVALERVRGFDERFPRAYREDADIALRVGRAGGRLHRGWRHVEHPVRPAGPLTSLRRQAGNRDDVRMRALHGRGWRDEAEAPPGRAPAHAAVTAFAIGAIGAALTGHRRTAVLAGCAWAGATTEFATTRIAAGPRTPGEIATMIGTSLVLPLLATAQRGAGLFAVALRRPKAWS